jgi:hypothetical protein
MMSKQLQKERTREESKEFLHTRRSEDGNRGVGVARHSDERVALLSRIDRRVI